MKRFVYINSKEVDDPSQTYANTFRTEAKRRDIVFEPLWMQDPRQLAEFTFTSEDIVFSFNKYPFFDIVKYLGIDTKVRYVINHIAWDYNISNKLMQQRIMHQFHPSLAIDTTCALDEAELSRILPSIAYPAIVKPTWGAKGNGITLAHTEEDIRNIFPTLHRIVQPFIQNDGDYRIFMVQGSIVGIIKRSRTTKDAIVNNVAKGGHATNYPNTEARYDELATAAMQVHKLFPLDWCGIDLIIDEQTGHMYFLEINAYPGWEGFEAATGISPSTYLFDFVASL